MSTDFDRDAIREHYDRLSPLYARFWGEHIHHGFWRNGESATEAQRQLVVELAARARVPRGAQVLDVGSGLGGSALWLARELDCPVVGITLSPVQAEIAAKWARRAGLDERVRFEVHDANDLAFPDQSFDAVWTIECTEHLFDKPEFFRRCARLLRPGGVLAVGAWLARASTAEHAQLLHRIRRAMLCPSLGSLQDYNDWIRASGFVDLRAEDVSEHVAQTWTRAGAILDRSEVRLILQASSEATREFAASFTAMRDAYAVGAMGYGLFAARKPARTEEVRHAP